MAKPPPPRRPSTRSEPVPPPIEDDPSDDSLDGELSAAESGATVVMSVPKPPEDEPQPSADSTVVFNTNSNKIPRAAAGPPAKLVVTRGPKAGSEFTLGPGESSLGRQNDNTVVIPDISVSRKHVVLRKEGAGYKLVDQGSGNGTQLNGQRLEGEAVLSDGDLFVMGDTEIKFVQPPLPSVRPAPRGAPPRPSARIPPSRSAVSRQPENAFGDADPSDEPTGMMPAVAPSRVRAAPKGKRKILLAALGVAFVGVGGLVVVKQRQQQKQVADETAKTQAEIDEIQQVYSSSFEEGKQLITAGDYKGAAAALEKASAAGAELVQREVMEADPLLRIKLEFAKKQFSFQEALEKAMAALDKGELAVATEEVKKVSEDSPLIDKVPEVLAAIKAKIIDRLAQGNAALASKEYELARAAAADVLVVDPGNAGAAELNKKIEKATGVTPVVRIKPVEIKPGDPTEGIMKAFLAGHLDEAIGQVAACDADSCKKLGEKLTAFRDAYKDLDGEGNADKANTLLRGLAGGASTPFQGPIASKVATSYTREGVKAMSAENYAKAFEAFRKAQSVDPGNALVEKNMKTIRIKAKELFDQAYVDKAQEPDKATKEFQGVISMTASDDELHQKARKHLKNIGGD
jgi:pSer/pThr/pTyr-binding forkhead associated (FHA) protein/tetratricopeptide (TPR) repeat protein